jgi:hypothetical protein
MSSLVSRNAEVCSREGKGLASFMIDTPTETNIYALSFLTYADGEQYIAIFNTGFAAATFSVRVDTGNNIRD